MKPKAESRAGRLVRLRRKKPEPRPRPGARRGATLLELAVTVAVGSVVFLIIGAIFLAQGRFFAIQDAISETQVNAFAAADAVGRYAGSARAVVSGAAINGASYTTSESTLVLRLPAIDAQGEVIAGAWDHVAFTTDPSDPSRFLLDLEADAASARESLTIRPAAFVDKLIFRYNAVEATSADAVELTIRTKKSVRGLDIVMPLGRTYFLGSS